MNAGYDFEINHEPFSSAKSGVHLLMAVRKGFFECGLHGSETRFLNGGGAFSEEAVAVRRLIRNMLERLPERRPTAREVYRDLLNFS